MKFIYTYTCNTRILSTSKERIDLKGLLSTSIALAITAAKWLLEEMGIIHIWIVMINPSMTRSISERIPTSNKICSLIPYLKHCGDLVWCMFGRMLTLCQRIVTHRPWRRLCQTIVVTRRQAVHQRNFAGSRTLPSLDSITLNTTEVSASWACMLILIVGVFTG